MPDLSTPLYSLGELLAWVVLALAVGYGIFPLRLALGEWLWKRSYAKRFQGSLTLEEREDRARLMSWGETRAGATPRGWKARAR